MRKKIFGLLLALCLVIGLLPVAAMAAEGELAVMRIGFSNVKLTAYDTPVYYKNATKEYVDTKGNAFSGYQPVLGDANNWNLKFEWKSGESAPTITLDGFIYDQYNNAKNTMAAKYDSENEEYTNDAITTYAIQTPTDIPCNLVITGKDSLLECYFGVTYKGNLNVTSVGDAKLVINSVASSFASGLADGSEKGYSLTVNANIDSHIRAYYNTAFTHNLQTYGADLTINGGNYNLTSAGTMGTMAIVARGEGSDIIINGGNFNCTSIVGRAFPNGVIDAVGKVIINGGTFDLRPQEAVGISGATGVEINGGDIKITSTCFAITAGDDHHSGGVVVINGGTLEMIINPIEPKPSDYIGTGAFHKVPTLGSKMNGLAGTSATDCDYYDETKINSLWVKLSDQTLVAPTKPTTPPAETTAPTTAPTAAPTATPTAAPTSATAAPTSATAAPTGSTTAPTDATAAPTGSTTAPTSATAAPTSTTAAPTGSTTAPTSGTTTPSTEKDAQKDGGSSAVIWIVIAVVVVAAGAAAAVIVIKKKKAAQ